MGKIIYPGIRSRAACRGVRGSRSRTPRRVSPYTPAVPGCRTKTSAYWSAGVSSRGERRALRGTGVPGRRQAFLFPRHHPLARRVLRNSAMRRSSARRDSCAYTGGRCFSSHAAIAARRRLSGYRALLRWLREGLAAVANLRSSAAFVRFYRVPRSEKLGIRSRGSRQVRA